MSRTNNIPELFKRKSEGARACFAGLMDALDWFTDYKYKPGPFGSSYASADFRISMLESKYRAAEYSAWQVRSQFREVCGVDWGVGADRDDVRRSYVYKCLGHTIPDRVFFRWPKVCVLVSVNLLRDRWIDAEESIAADDEACLFYSRLVLKGRRLPWRMHNTIVMRSFLGTSPAMLRYLAEIG